MVTIVRRGSVFSAFGNVISVLYPNGKFEISILELAKFVIKNLKSKSEIQYTNYDDAYSSGFEDMVRRVPDISKIKKYIGWEPITPLGEIIKDVAGNLLK